MPIVTVRTQPVYAIPNPVGFTGFVNYRAIAAKTPGLVAYWGMGDAASPLSARVGGAALTVFGSPVFGGASATPRTPANLSWNSNGSGYATGSPPVPSGAAARTVALFVKTTATGALFGWGNASTRQMWVVRLSAATTLMFNGYNDDPTISVPGINDGAFHHLAVAYNGNVTEKTWLDGVALGSVNHAGALNTGSGNFGIGRDQPEAAWQSNASLQEVGVWSRVLTDAEVAALYAGR